MLSISAGWVCSKTSHQGHHSTLDRWQSKMLWGLGRFLSVLLRIVAYLMWYNCFLTTKRSMFFLIAECWASQLAGFVQRHLIRDLVTWTLALRDPCFFSLQNVEHLSWLGLFKDISSGTSLHPFWEKKSLHKSEDHIQEVCKKFVQMRWETLHWCIGGNRKCS